MHTRHYCIHLVVLAQFVLLSCVPIQPTNMASPQPTPTTPPPRLSHEQSRTQLSFADFLDDAYDTQLRRNPELVSELGLATRLEMDHGNLTDISPAFQAATYALLEAQLSALHRYDYASLSQGEQLSYDLFAWSLNDQLQAKAFQFHQYPDNQIFGIHNQLIDFLTERHPLESLQDARDYISRLQQVPDKIKHHILWLDARAAAGIAPPHFMVTHVLRQLDQFTRPQPQFSVLVLAFDSKLSNLPGITQTQRTALNQNATDAVTHNVMPAYSLLRDYLSQLDKSLAQTAPANEDGPGFWQHPNGDAAYAYWLSHHTTTDLSADEIHELGLREVARIQHQMDLLFAALNITTSGSSADALPAKMRQVAQRSGYMATGTDDADQTVATAYQTLIDAAHARMIVDYFNIAPQADIIVKLVRLPNAPGAYYIPPALDSSRPGVFYANVASGSVFRYGMPTLAYHEGVPGHHFQIALQRELQNLPTFRTTSTDYTAYVEGWALYAERLAWEAGFYDADPHGNLGRLQGELFRAARLVADTGLHARGWTRADAVEYMVKNVGYSRAAMTVEVERYVVWPGQATAYKIGMLRILELRKRAQDALGVRFDIKAFHDAILSNGAMPLTLLERVVDMYIEETLAFP